MNIEHFLLKMLENSADSQVSKDSQDQLTFDVPLLIRLFELVREEVKSDEELHHLVSRILVLKDKGTLTMADYEAITSKPSDESPPVVATEADLDSLRRLAGL